jgi:hypothetical protein
MINRMIKRTNSSDSLGRAEHRIFGRALPWPSSQPGANTLSSRRVGHIGGWVMAAGHAAEQAEQ